MTYKETLKNNWGLLLTLILIIANFFLPLVISILVFLLFLFPLLLFLISKRVIESKFLALLFSSFVWFVLTVLIIVGIAYIFVNDVKNIQKDLQEKPKIIAFQEETKITFAVKTNLMSLEQPSREEGLQSIEILSEEQEEVLLENAKTEKENIIFIVKKEVFEGIELNYLGKKITEEEAFALLESQVKKETKLFVLMLLFKSYLEQKHPLILLQEFRQHNIEIYPSYITLKVIQTLPEEMIDLAVREAEKQLEN